MAGKMEPGVVRVAHTRVGDEGPDEVVIAELDDEGIAVSWPRTLRFADAFSLNNPSRAMPDPLILRDGDGWLTLTEGSPHGVSASTLGH